MRHLGQVSGSAGRGSPPLVRSLRPLPDRCPGQQFVGEVIGRRYRTFSSLWFTCEYTLGSDHLPSLPFHDSTVYIVQHMTCTQSTRCTPYTRCAQCTQYIRCTQYKRCTPCTRCTHCTRCTLCKMYTLYKI